MAGCYKLHEKVPREFQSLEELVYQVHESIGSRKTSKQTVKSKNVEGAGHK